MSLLRGIEQKIEGLFEGVFGRAFRTNVQPVELARKLVKEMEDHRLTSVSKVYVPNEYTIFLSTADRGQFESYEDALAVELQEYVAEHARREGYLLITAPRVLFETDTDLTVGEFGIATRMVQGPVPAQPRAPSAVPEAAGSTMVYRPPPGSEPVAERAILTLGGEVHELEKSRVVIGRSKECDLQVQDPNISRRHAEVQLEGSEYWLVDLGSTNGVQVNGRRTSRAKLESGDRITLGSTDLVFERRRA